MRSDANGAQAVRADRHHYVVLDAIRGVAAFMVVLLHSSRLAGGQWAPHGYLAVDLFFVLSGFVIAHAYDSRMRQGMPARAFMILRLIRFMPLYWLGLAFGVLHQLLLIVTHNAHALSWSALTLGTGMGALFLPAPMIQPNGNLFPFNVPSWSLFFELAVNLLYGLLFIRLSNKVLVSVVLLSGCGLVAFCFWHGNADIGATDMTIVGGAVRTLFSFPLGILLYRRPFWRVGLPWPILLLIVMGLMIVPVPQGYIPLYDALFILVASPLLVAAGAASKVEGKGRKIASFVGILSFPIYAVHRPLIDLATPVLERLPVASAGRMVLFLAGLIIFAALLDRLYDRPARQWVARRRKRRAERDLPEASLP